MTEGGEAQWGPDSVGGLEHQSRQAKDNREVVI